MTTDRHSPVCSTDTFRKPAWVFKHTTSLPRYPEANGMTETSVQTVKKLFTKAGKRDGYPYLVLLDLRNTPVAGCRSTPVQILQSRRMRTNIPTAPRLLEPQLVDDSIQEMLKKKHVRTRCTMTEKLARYLC